MKQSNSYSCVIDESHPSCITNANVFEWVIKGEISSLELLSRKSPNQLSCRDENGTGPIHHAAASGRLDIIRLIISTTGPQELDVQNAEGQTPLHFAVEKNQESSCLLLLDMGANPNILNTVLMAPVHLAISRQQNQLIEALLSCPRTDVNLEGDLGNTPLMLACSYNNCEALRILFKYGPKLCHQNKLGHYAIHTVAFSGAKEAMEMVLERGEELGLSTLRHVNYLDKSKSSPLHLAVRGGNTDAIKLCIAKGAKVDQKQCDKSTALHFACTQGAMEAVQAMIESYEQVDDIINITDGAKQTPLHRVTLFDHFKLAEYLVSKGAKIDCVDCKGLTPLLLATTCSAWKTVSFLLSIGADFRIKDNTGRGFLHLVVFQPKGLINLPEHILQNADIRELMSDEDLEGCTPLHYACKLGTHQSVKNMLGFDICLGHKSKEKKSALHFAAEYGRVNTCHRLLETITDSRLLNEADAKGLTPLHLASKGGHTKVVDLLLRRGALFQSDYKGWSCLHHAAAEGYTQTMTILLTASINLLNNTDEDGNTALHIAAREGQIAAVKLLLNRGADLVLNKNHSSFFHEAIRSGKKDVANIIIENDRCIEAMSLFKLGFSRCSMMDLIEFLPESTKHLLDQCLIESEHDPNDTNYHIIYNFRFLQAPIKLQKSTQVNKTHHIQPLAALNAMVQYNRLELLNHPVCQKYLEMKWKAYGSKAHLLNLAVYLLGLLPLNLLLINLRPTQNDMPNSTTNSTPFSMEPASPNMSSFTSVCMLMVFIMNVYAIIKEMIQIAHQFSTLQNNIEDNRTMKEDVWNYVENKKTVQSCHQSYFTEPKRMNYFLDPSNLSDWFTAIFSLAFVIPMFLGVEKEVYWSFGALAILLAWGNFLLYFQRFERFGIYVVMFGEIMRTLISILILFTFLLLAFSLSFHALMLHRMEFSSIGLAVAQTFVMMVGELNYQTSFLEAYEHEFLVFPKMTYFIFVVFVLIMPILLMNLMIGLAVGDIAEVQRNASLKRIAMQINLHTNLEEKLPYWFIKRVDKPCITIYPNRNCAKINGMVEQMLWNFNKESGVRTRFNMTPSTTLLEREVMKQKYRLKEISCVLEKQHTLMKLIIEKMEIKTEAEEIDGPCDLPSVATPKSQKSHWVPLVKALKAKKCKSHITSSQKM